MMRDDSMIADSESAVAATAGVVRLRPAVAEDAATVFGWRNLPFIVALGSTQREVTWEEHLSWFVASVRGTARSLFVIEVDGEPAGQLRFDWLTPVEAEISLYLLPRFVGRGLGVQAIRLGCAQAKTLARCDRVVAWVREENGPSLVAFQRAGFIRADAGFSRTGHVRLQMEIRARVPHNRLTFGVEEEQAVIRVVRSGRWAGGATLREFESKVARTAGVSSAVGVGSGLGALRLALLALGVQSDDAVAVPAYSCVALANAVLACGANIVPIEVEQGTWNISVAALRAALGARRDIKAAIAVHTFGLPAPVRELEELGVPVIEDCSHAFGREPLGRQSRVAMLSLYATKLIGAGEGGVVLTSDEKLAEAIRASRDYVDQQPSAHRLNDKLSELSAALALAQLDRLPAMLARREEIARRYTTLLLAAASAGGFTLPCADNGRVWYRYAVEVENAAEVTTRLASLGIDAARPVEDWREQPISSALSVAARAYRQIVSLPLFPTLKPTEQDRVVAAFLESVRFEKTA